MRDVYFTRAQVSLYEFGTRQKARENACYLEEKGREKLRASGCTAGEVRES